MTKNLTQQAIKCREALALKRTRLVALLAHLARIGADNSRITRVMAELAEVREAARRVLKFLGWSLASALEAGAIRTAGAIVGAINIIQ